MERAITPRSRPSSAQSIGAVIVTGLASVAPTLPSTNRETLSTFMASRRPTFIWLSSNGESSPGRAMAARQRTASAPYLSRISVGTTTLPFDFDIFLRSGSRMNPETRAWLHGAAWFS